MAQVVEHLPSKYKALSSNTCRERERERERKRKEGRKEGRKKGRKKKLEAWLKWYST
jgi:ribosomal protein L19E